jgi:hypothetical protein
MCTMVCSMSRILPSSSSSDLQSRPLRLARISAICLLYEFLRSRSCLRCLFFSSYSGPEPSLSERASWTCLRSSLSSRCAGVGRSQGGWEGPQGERAAGAGACGDPPGGRSVRRSPAGRRAAPGWGRTQMCPLPSGCPRQGRRVVIAPAGAAAYALALHLLVVRLDLLADLHQVLGQLLNGALIDVGAGHPDEVQAARDGLGLAGGLDHGALIGGVLRGGLLRTAELGHLLGAGGQVPVRRAVLQRVILDGSGSLDQGVVGVARVRHGVG